MTASGSYDVLRNPKESSLATCGHAEHTTGFTGKRLGRYEEFQPWEPCGWPPHHEHWVGYGDEGSPECCICPGSPCGEVTVQMVLDHRVYDEASAERRGAFLCRVMVSEAISKALGGVPEDSLSPDAEHAWRTCWEIARGEVDEPPF